MKINAEKIIVPVSFEKPPKEEITLAAFLFTRKGKLIQQSRVVNNSAEFNNPGCDMRDLRVFIAPASDKQVYQVSSIAGLERYKPYEPILSSSAKADGRLTVAAIPGILSRYWLFCRCRVTGAVSKWFNINNDWQDRPLCQARVHICDIDAIWYWIYRIPDYIIAKVPEAILNPAAVAQFHPPLPDPGPVESFSVLARTKSASANIFNTTSAAEALKTSGNGLPVLSDEIRQKLGSGNLNVIRETIAKNYHLFHPWFCLWPWCWPYFYFSYETAVVYTDVNGRFDSEIFYWCEGERPDIYIWVECMIDGIWTTVYRPPVPCFTYWNYLCGTDINIQVTDPRVFWGCNEIIGGDVVWIKTVGQSASVSHINQYNIFQPPPDQTVSYNRIGLTDAAAINDPSFLPTTPGDYKRPFGAALTFVLQFGDGMPNAGLYYYRWSYMKTANADLSPYSDIYHPLTNGVQKSYTFEYTDGTGTHFGVNNFTLGPVTVGASSNLYVIPPVSPADAPVLAAETSPFWDQNTYSISFDSSGMDDGLYEFKLELFDQTGKLLTGIPKNIFQVPDAGSFAPSVNAPDKLLENPISGMPGTADAYNMLMRLDNSACQGKINTVKINGVISSSDCCGFVSYKPLGVESENIELSFLATHPNNFAVFDFGVVKGTCGDVKGTDVNGMVIDSADGYTLTGGVYDKSFTPAELLTTCYDAGAGKAAFAESLYVAAMATDGTFRVSGKDAPDTAAFALEP